ncbi:MAG: flagellar hook-associated protein FlgK [Alphaproteobacteria bacterium]|nr:MAG: flagellar hook-associated protein FlgK [Alphaproteobacteria bacterium]
MSLGSILNNASSGLATAQAQLRVVSDNVANVNTKGYVRKIADQQSLTSQGVGSGVELGRVRLATDRFLQAASLSANADAGRYAARSELYDRIQTQFGDPGSTTGFFSSIDGMFAAFATIAEDASSSPRRQEALFKAEALFEEAARVTGQIQATREDADGRIGTAVERVNGLLRDIDALNVEISRATALNADSSGAQGAQAMLVAELGKFLDVRSTGTGNGGISLRTGGGALLVGPGAATLEYQRAGKVTPETVFSEVLITEPGGQIRPLTDLITTGEIKGLLELRDVDAPETAERLAELLTHVADELNRAHNAHSAVPAPAVLTGRNIGQSLEAALGGFTGSTTVAITNPAGLVQARADIVFSGSTLTINGNAATPANFLTVLNAQLGASGTASFNNGVLSIAATGGNGVAIGDDPANPSKNGAGRGFSHFFGLNDLIQSDRPALYETGLSGASPHGFTAGETVRFRLSDDRGSKLRDVTFTVPAGATVNDLRAALNDPITGIGRYGSFSLSSAGELTFQGNGDPAPTLKTLDDQTAQVPSGVSFTQLFGVGAGIRASRADSFSVRSDVRQNPAKLALAQFDLTAAVGSRGLLSGDGRGATALADAGNRATAFQAAGGARSSTQTVSRYAAELSGAIGGKAASAKSRADSAEAIRTEATARQTAFEGVNLDEELVLLTTYQQAFNASARLIQASRELYDILLGMI